MSFCCPSCNKSHTTSEGLRSHVRRKTKKCQSAGLAMRQEKRINDMDYITSHLTNIRQIIDNDVIPPVFISDKQFSENIDALSPLIGAVYINTKFGTVHQFRPRITPTGEYTATPAWNMCLRLSAPLASQ